MEKEPSDVVASGHDPVTSSRPGSGPPSGEPDVAAPARRHTAWFSMAAVAAALVMLSLLSGPDGFDPDAPPPAADGSTADADENLAAGTVAPLDFTLKDMNGIDVRLASFKGKVILINFWATWCGPCRVEIPYLIELQREYGEDLVVLGVSIDDTAEQLMPYATEMSVNYPLLVGNGRQDFQDAYGPFWGIPVTVFVTRDGLIHKKHSGIASKAQFEHEITSLL
ncbi:MAG: TlpA disulfide reductase family protein [Acidobacteria bacterium]|nr:TlpA disulfide reductase family protein [Acidobacteriota bacterium]